MKPSDHCVCLERRADGYPDDWTCEHINRSKDSEECKVCPRKQAYQTRRQATPVLQLIVFNGGAQSSRKPACP